MDTKREDRRVRRSRRMMHEALRALILEKGYDGVTVQDVIDRADVGRTTFYAHFRDKDDLLASGLQEMREAVEQMVTPLTTHGNDSERAFGFTRALFEHAAGHRSEFRALSRSRNEDLMRTSLQEGLTSLVQATMDRAMRHHRTPPLVPVEIVTHYVVSALLSLLMWWLDNNLPYPAEQMAQMFERLTRPVISAALGVSGHTS